MAPGDTQAFYFDDFTGATFLGTRSATLTGTDDRALLNFVAMLRQSPSAGLILSTRGHISD